MHNVHVINTPVVHQETHEISERWQCICHKKVELEAYALWIQIGVQQLRETTEATTRTALVQIKDWRMVLSDGVFQITTEFQFT
jgi:hypothetical protein